MQMFPTLEGVAPTGGAGPELPAV